MTGNKKGIERLSNRNISLLIFIFSIILSSVAGCDRKGSQSSKENAKQSGPDLGEYTLSLSGDEPSVDMKQFGKTVEDVPYASASKAQILDIIYPDKGSPPYPVIVGIHGGGWKAGDKRMESLSALFKAAYQGYALVTINYRLSNEARWPAQLNDAKAAIRFLRTNAEKYQLNTDKIVAWGSSTGGHISQMLAATNGRPEFEDLTLGNKNVSSDIQGVISWYGASDITALAPAGVPAVNEVLGFDAKKNVRKASLASPINYVTRDYPPILLVHGTNDHVVPYQQSVKMYNKVNQLAGLGRAQIKLIQGATHGGDLIKTDQNVKENLYFADEVLWDGDNPHRTDTIIEIRVK